MYRYIFNTKGKYVAFIINDKYCFSKNNDYIGFFIGVNLYDYSGKYLGTLTSDDRIIKEKNRNIPNVVPITKPYKPFLPYAPYNRYAMSRLPSNYEDIFIDGYLNNYLDKLDIQYKKYINCNIYTYDRKKFLGTINFNKYDTNSLANKYGTYGNQYSQDSVFNKYGTYGSQYNNESPFNKYTNTPPVIVDPNGNVVGILTSNKYVSLSKEIVDAVEFFNWFNSKLER